MRILAVFLVLMNHEPAFRLFLSGHGNGVGECLAVFEAVIIKINVPLFAMISGALLLGRDETISQIWHKRISRILWVILLFSGLLYVELGWFRDRSINFHDFFYGLIASNLKSLTPYWYLYAYLGFLLMLPYIRKIAQKMSKAEFLWLLGIHFVFSSLLPIIGLALKFCGESDLNVSQTIGIPMSSVTLIFYPLIGYYLDKNVNVGNITYRLWTYVGVLFVITNIITVFAVMTEGVNFKYSQNYLGLFVYVNSIIVFLLIKKLFTTEFLANHIKLCKIVTFIGPLSFGIYLLDMAVQLPIYREMKATTIPAVGYFWFSFLWCLTSFVLGGTITYILKKMPFFKKLL